MPFEKLAHIVPFLALTAKHPAVRLENRPLLTRLIEQSTVGFVAAAIAIYANDVRQSEQIQTIKVSMERDHQDMKEIKSELLAEIRLVRSEALSRKTK